VRVCFRGLSTHFFCLLVSATALESHQNAMFYFIEHRKLNNKD
jgi:hypothetical protein